MAALLLLIYRKQKRSINLSIRDADSVTLWLEKSDLENISSYIRKKLNDAMSK
jgi:hypothetical protein